MEFKKEVNCVLLTTAKPEAAHKIMESPQENGIPERLIVLMRNLYTVQQAMVRTENGQTEWFHIGKEIGRAHV